MMEPSKSDLTVFVGQRSDYYLKAWFPQDPAVQSVTGAFNGSAFWGALLWLAYRKMYGLSACLVGVLCVMQIAMAMLILLLRLAFPGFLSSALIFSWVVAGIPLVALFSLAVFCGTYGNLWYQGYVYNSVSKVRELGLVSSSEVTTALSQRGGTSGLAVLSCVVILVVMQALLAGVFQFVLSLLQIYFV